MPPLFACQKKSSKTKYVLVVMPQVFQVSVPLLLPSNRVIARGQQMFVHPYFSPSGLFLKFFFFPFRKLTHLSLVQFCPTKTILTFVGIQVNAGF